MNSTAAVTVPQAVKDLLVEQYGRLYQSADVPEVAPDSLGKNYFYRFLIMHTNIKNINVQCHDINQSINILHHLQSTDYIN
jgi:hypothetical protein